MSQESTIILIGAVLGSTVIGSILTMLFMRRKVAAETRATDVKAASEEVDTQIKVSDLLEKMQSENVDLYKRNIALEKVNADHTHTIDILTARLEVRDKQLESATKQIDLLRNLAEQTPITETLRGQLDVMNQIVSKLQSAQEEGQRIMLEKEKAMQELSITNRDLVIKKSK
jgi:hypothetical protein